MLLVLSSLMLVATAENGEDASDNNVDKRVPHMMVWDYYQHQPRLEQDDVRKKRTPLLYPPPADPSPGMRFYKTNWFKRSQEEIDAHDDTDMHRDRKGVYFIPPSSLYEQEAFNLGRSKRGIPYYYPVTYYPYAYRKRYRMQKRETSPDSEDQEAPALEEDKRGKRGLFWEDLKNDDPTAFGWDRKRRGTSQ